MNYSSRFFLYAPLALFLSLAVGVGIHWWVVASAFSDRLAAWNGHEIVPGVRMQFASRRISGFPFSLDTVFQDVLLRIETPRGPTLWRTEHFAMHALTYGREETIFEAAGRQELRWTGDDGATRDLIFAVGSLHASAIQDKGGLTRFDLDLVGLGSRPLIAKRLQLHIRQNKSDKLDFAATADDVMASQAFCPALDGGLKSGGLAGSVSQAQAFSSLRAGDQEWSAAVANWRVSGGRVENDGIWVSPAGPRRSGTPIALRLERAFSLIPADRLFGVTEFLDTVCATPRY